MNSQEAKFLLQARRPGGRDAGDPIFAAAMAAADGDPRLKAWHEREERFDARLAGKLAEIAPPAELRAAILAGARASASPRREWWRPATWLAVAAAVALLMALAGRGGSFGQAGWSAKDLAAFALEDTTVAHGRHVGRPVGLEALQVRLAGGALRREGALDLAELRQKRCRSVRVGDREVFEICFQREGAWYHLYTVRRAGGGAELREFESAAGGGFVAAAWSDARNSYALVTQAGREALRRAL